MGTLKSDLLHVVPKKQLSHLHISRLSPKTTEADLERFFKQHIQDISCEKLNSKQPDVYSSFKVTVPADFLEKALSPEFWPEGVAINKFFMKRRHPVIKI